MKVNQGKIARFNDTHDVTEEQQFKELVRAVGELAKTYNADTDDTSKGKELADAVFHARSLAEVRDINLTQLVNETIEENVLVNTLTDGDGVTQSTSAWTIEEWDSYEYDRRTTYVDAAIPDDEEPTLVGYDCETDAIAVDVWNDDSVFLYPEGLEPGDAEIDEFERRMLKDDEDPIEVAMEMVLEHGYEPPFTIEDPESADWEYLDRVESGGWVDIGGFAWDADTVEIHRSEDVYDGDCELPYIVTADDVVEKDVVWESRQQPPVDDDLPTYGWAVAEHAVEGLLDEYLVEHEDETEQVDVSRPGHRFFNVAREVDDVVSTPIDVADAARLYESHAHGSLNSICKLRYCDGEALLRDTQWTVYQVKSHGAVFTHDKGALACPIEQVQDVVDHVVEETDYVVTYTDEDSEYVEVDHE